MKLLSTVTTVFLLFLHLAFTSAYMDYSPASVPNFHPAIHPFHHFGPYHCPSDGCPFRDGLQFINPSLWIVSNNVLAGGRFDGYRSNKQVYVVDRHRGVLHMGIGRDYNSELKQEWASAQIVSKNAYGAGCYEVVMKPSGEKSVITNIVLVNSKSVNPDGSINLGSGHLYTINLGALYTAGKNTVSYRTVYTYDNEEAPFKDQEPGGLTSGFNYWQIKVSSRGVFYYLNGRLMDARTGSNVPTPADGPYRIFITFSKLIPDLSNLVGDFDESARHYSLLDGISFKPGEYCHF